MHSGLNLLLGYDECAVAAIELEYIVACRPLLGDINRLRRAGAVNRSGMRIGLVVDYDVGSVRVVVHNHRIAGDTYVQIASINLHLEDSR